MKDLKEAPWISMAEFCQIHKIPLSDFKNTMITNGLAEVAQVSVNITSHGVIKTKFVPTSASLIKNIARKSGKGKKSHNLASWHWRNAYISKVFKVA